MHEFEQGVWKNLFTHLTRMLHASDSSLVIEMDRRYVPVLSHAIIFMQHASGTVWFPDLDVPFASSQLALLSRKKWLQGIMRIFYKYVPYLCTSNKLSENVSSAQCLCLTAFSRTHTMTQYKSFYLLAHTGTHSPSFECIPSIHCGSSKNIQRSWGISLDSLLRSLAWTIALLNFLVRRQHVNGDNPRSHKSMFQMTTRPRAALVGRRPSI